MTADLWTVFTRCTMYLVSTTTIWPQDIRCTNASLEAFGIVADEVVYDTATILEYLVRDGYSWVPVTDGRDEHGYYEAQHTDLFGDWGQKTPTLRKFCAAFPEGDYVLGTAGHSLVLRDGVLTDTEGRGPDGRRVVLAFRITRETV